MKSKTKILTLGLCAGLLALSSCSDFEDINVDPTKAEGESLRAEWALNKAISDAQMNPDIAERIVVYNWGSAARICGEMTFLNLGRYNDSYMTGSYYPAICAWIRAATLAISVVDDEEGLWTPQQVRFYPNLKQYARIWRAYLISEFSDSLGPYALESFQGVNPTFNSVEEVYDYSKTFDSGKTIQYRDEWEKSILEFRTVACKLKKMTSLLKTKDWYFQITDVTQAYIPHSFILDTRYNTL